MISLYHKVKIILAGRGLDIDDYVGVNPGVLTMSQIDEVMGPVISTWDEVTLGLRPTDAELAAMDTDPTVAQAHIDDTYRTILDSFRKKGESTFAKKYQGGRAVGIEAVLAASNPGFLMKAKMTQAEADAIVADVDTVKTDFDNAKAALLAAKDDPVDPIAAMWGVVPVFTDLGVRN